MFQYFATIFQCHGNPTEFYIYTLYTAAVLTAVYILCNFYNCLWLLFPQFGKLSRVMSAYKYNMLEAAKGGGKTDRYAYIYLHIYSYIYLDIYKQGGAGRPVRYLLR